MKHNLKRVLSLLVITVMMAGTFVTPVSADTTEENYTCYNIVYNADGRGEAISAVMNDKQGEIYPKQHNSHIWFGDISKYKTGSEKDYRGDAFWRVVSSNKDYTGNEGGRMFLASEFTWGTSMPNDNVQTALKTIYGKAFSNREKDAILKVDNTGNTGTFKYYKPTWDNSTSDITLSDDSRLFSLSAKEIHDYFALRPTTHKGSDSTTNKASAAYAADRLEFVPKEDSSERYWLRTRGSYYAYEYIGGKYHEKKGWGYVETAAPSNNDRIVNIADENLSDIFGDSYKYDVRPAFNLDLSKVLFASLAEGSVKSEAFGSMHAVGTFERDQKAGEDWKLTLIDNSRSLNITDAVYYDATMNKAKIIYSNASAGYISAVILDTDNNVRYYGRVCKVDDDYASGSFDLDLSNVATSSTDTLYLFSEDYKGDYMTDYASEPKPVDLTMKQSYPIVTFAGGNEGAVGFIEPIELTKLEDKIKLPECTYKMPPNSPLSFIGWKKDGRTARYLPGETVTINSHTTFTAQWGKSWSGLQEQINGAASGATITLKDDYYAVGNDVWLTIPQGKTITIDLNGHTLDRNLISSAGVLSTDQKTAENGGVFYVKGNGTKLIIKDTNGGGRISGGCAVSVEDGDKEIHTGGGITVTDNAVVEFNGGSITANYGSTAGGVAASNGAKFIMNGGTIKQNNGAYGGAGATFDNGSFTLNNGEITSNFNMGFGTGGIYVYRDGIANIFGGRISSNTGAAGGGVMVTDASGKLNVKGSPVISNNYSMLDNLTDVVLTTDSTINVVGELSDNAVIKFARAFDTSTDEQNKPERLRITNGLNGNGKISSFVSTDPDYMVGGYIAELNTETEGEAYQAGKIYIYFYEDDGNDVPISGLTIDACMSGYISSFPTCNADRDGSKFKDWTVKSQMPDKFDDLTVPGGGGFTVIPQCVATDDNGRRYVYVYANWEEHSHKYVKADDSAAFCKGESNKDIYVCEGCGRFFIQDEDGSYKTIPASGHEPGDSVKENRVDATYESIGGYDLVKRCTKCGEEINRTHVVIPRLKDDEYNIDIKTKVEGSETDQGGTVEGGKNKGKKGHTYRLTPKPRRGYQFLYWLIGGKTRYTDYYYDLMVNESDETVSVTVEAVFKRVALPYGGGVSMYVGETYDLAGKIYPEETTPEGMTWESSDTKVARVDSKGVITAVSVGTAEVKGKLSDGTEEVIYTVTVEKKTSGQPGGGSSSGSIEDAEVVLSAKSFVYNGKVRKPVVETVDGEVLTEGTDYTVEWSDESPKNVGSYTITITGIGKYKGVTKATYKINPKGTSLKKLKKAKKAITVKWKKQSAKMAKSRITGYQIQLATNKKFTKNRKTVTVKGYKKVSKKVTKLKGGKKYFVRVRTYKTVNGKKLYSKWSKVKTVKTRK